MNLTLQYVIVGIIIAAVVAKVIIGLLKQKKHPTGCCGCPLSESCKSKSNDADSECQCHD